MDAIAYLQQQHREVEQLFSKLSGEEGELELAERRELFVQLADALSAHTAIEEESFYPAAKSPSTEGILRESVEEHLAIKRGLADLLDMEPDDERFAAALKTLEEEVSHHVNEEETVLMPRVRQAMDEAALDELGVELEGDYEALMEEEPHHRILDELSEPAPI